jgi:ABC-type sugar transport system ATPase subunit
MSQEDLPENVDNIDGSHCGDNYLAFTFYLFNASDVDHINYEWQVKMSNIHNGLDEAIRVKLFVNGESTVYAKTASDGSGPEPNTTEFYSSEVVAMGRHPYTGYFGRLSDADENIIDEALRQVHVEHFAQRKFSSLSDGERQKVMIAKALAQQTPMILMDEPSAFLDFPSKVELMLLLRELAHTQEKAILLSTHDVGIALKMADELWLMQDQNMTIGTPQELLQSGKIDSFLGESKMYV